MADRERLELRVSVEWLARLDELRGGEPRSTFLKGLLDGVDRGPGISKEMWADKRLEQQFFEEPVSVELSEVPLPKIAPRRSF